MIYVIPVVLMIVGAIGAFGGFSDVMAAKYAPQQTIGVISIFGGLTVVAISYSAILICSKIEALIEVQKRSAVDSDNAKTADAAAALQALGVLQPRKDAVSQAFGETTTPLKVPSQDK